MSSNPETFKAAWIANIKSFPSMITPIIPDEVKDVEYQSTDWIYPCIRISLEFRPASIYCGPDDADVEIEVWSAEKSSKQSVHIASMIFEQYHGHPFSQGDIRFSTSVVRKIEKPDRTVYGWVTKVHIFCQGVATA
jgi:hypothetical protein